MAVSYLEMTIEYVWSPSTAGFYPIVEKERLMAAGGWPADGVDVTGEEYTALFPTPPGKFIDTLNGRPQWVDMPPPSKEQLISMAENERSAKRSVADNEISWRQDAVDAGIATKGETDDLAAWKKYRVLLMRIDTSKAPDIEWPTQPEVRAR
ncbi:tail fiber assembly protein [Enterobacter roggenkampii]|uniref:tail fiber assembly protein n=2 Tax=Enterobacter TaxID=547 RepID=UPI001D081410|nr:tail fiber assembly protein [Enterobacter roggenkampii]